MSFFSKKYESFNDSIIKKVTSIPFDNDMYIPQGVCYANGYIFLTMYDYEKKNNSLIYVFKDNKLVKKLFLDNKAHCGGISYDEKSNCIFLSGIGFGKESYVYRYLLSDILLKKDSVLELEYKFEVDNDNLLYSSSAKHSSVSFLNCFNGYLYVGNYCSCDDIDKAIIKKHKILSDGGLSKTFDIFKCPFSNVQGICVFTYNSETLYLFSRSFGRKRNSLIYVCKLNNDCFSIISTMVLPSMLEQVSLCEEGFVLIFESGAKVFRDTVINVNDGIYIIDINKVINSHDNYKDFCKNTSLFVSNSKYRF